MLILHPYFIQDGKNPHLNEYYYFKTAIFDNLIAPEKALIGDVSKSEFRISNDKFGIRQFIT